MNILWFFALFFGFIEGVALRVSEPSYGAHGATILGVVPYEGTLNKRNRPGIAGRFRLRRCRGGMMEVNVFEEELPNKKYVRPNMGRFPRPMHPQGELMRSRPARVTGL